MNFAAENVTITPSNPLIVRAQEPSILNFGSITIEDGAEIQFYSDANLTTQSIRFIGTAKIKFIGEPGTNANPKINAGHGGDGGNAPGGTLRLGTISGNAQICILAGVGGNGSAGNPTGGNGGKGGDGGTVTVYYSTLESNSEITPVTPQALGGKGGPGAQGINGTDTGNDGFSGNPGQVIVQQLD